MRYLGGKCEKCGMRYSDIKSKKDHRTVKCVQCGEKVLLKTEWVLLPVYSLEELGQHYKSGEPIETVDGPKKLIGGENHYLEKKGESES